MGYLYYRMNGCMASQQIKRIIDSHPTLRVQIQQVCFEQQRGSFPAFIRATPTLIIPSIGRPLVGQDALNKIQELATQHNPQQQMGTSVGMQPGELEPYGCLSSLVGSSSTMDGAPVDCGGFAAIGGDYGLGIAAPAQNAMRDGMNTNKSQLDMRMQEMQQMRQASGSIGNAALPSQRAMPSMNGGGMGGMDMGMGMNPQMGGFGGGMGGMNPQMGMGGGGFGGGMGGMNPQMGMGGMGGGGFGGGGFARGGMQNVKTPDSLVDQYMQQRNMDIPQPIRRC